MGRYDQRNDHHGEQRRPEPKPLLLGIGLGTANSSPRSRPSSFHPSNWRKALARRLAVIMHRIRVVGTEFRWPREVTAA